MDPDPELNYGSGSEHANNFGSGRIRIHNPAFKTAQAAFKILYPIRFELKNTSSFRLKHAVPVPVLSVVHPDPKLFSRKDPDP